MKKCCFSCSSLIIWFIDKKKWLLFKNNNICEILSDLKNIETCFYIINNSKYKLSYNIYNRDNLNGTNGVNTSSLLGRSPVEQTGTALAGGTTEALKETYI